MTDRALTPDDVIIKKSASFPGDAVSPGKPLNRGGARRHLRCIWSKRNDSYLAIIDGEGVSVYKERLRNEWKVVRASPGPPESVKIPGWYMAGSALQWEVSMKQKRYGTELIVGKPLGGPALRKFQLYNGLPFFVGTSADRGLARRSIFRASGPPDPPSQD